MKMRASYNVLSSEVQNERIIADMKMRASYNRQPCNEYRPKIIADMKMRASYNCYRNLWDSIKL